MNPTTQLLRSRTDHNGTGDHEFILLVDDDEAIREAIAEVLADENFAVQGVKNGREALALLKGGARPCMVLLDLMMPVMNGWDLARELGQDPTLADIPICVITTVGSSRPIPREAVAIVRKPLVLDELLNVIQRLC